MKILFVYFLAAIKCNQMYSFIIGESLIIRLLEYNAMIDNRRNTIDQLLVNFAEQFKNNIANQSTALYLNDIHLVNLENNYMNVNGTLSNIEVKGFDKIEILNVNATVFGGNKWIINFTIPDLEFKANYSLSGDLKLDNAWITNNTISPQNSGVIKTHLYNVTSAITTTLDIDLLSRNVKIQNVTVDYNYGKAETTISGLDFLGSSIGNYALNPIANLIVEFYLIQYKLNIQESLASAVENKLNPIMMESAIFSLTEVILKYSNKQTEQYELT